jgi:hypothetical protein
MLPSSIDDYVSLENIVRFIDAVDREIKANIKLFLKSASPLNREANKALLINKLNNALWNEKFHLLL